MISNLSKDDFSTSCTCRIELYNLTGAAVFSSGYCCCCSVAQLCPTLWDPIDCSMPSFPVFHHLLEFVQVMSFESVMSSNHLILCHCLLLSSVFPSIIVFSNDSSLLIRSIKWPKYWSFSFSICPPSECLGLISFRIDWFDLLAVQGTFKSLL